MRQLKRTVKIGNITIGGTNPIAVQTMLNVPVEDIEGNVAQAKRCEAAGCQILPPKARSPASPRPGTM
mgnify:CR=1 FL=1